MERLCEASPKSDKRSKYCMWCGLVAFEGDGVAYLAGVLVAHDCCIPEREKFKPVAAES